MKESWAEDQSCNGFLVYISVSHDDVGKRFYGIQESAMLHVASDGGSRW